MQYVARQAILDSNRTLQAYELLFRDSLENRCPEEDPNLASKKTMDTAVLYGLNALSDGYEIFLNCTHDLVVEGLPTLFSPEKTVVEILETAQATPELVGACASLKRAGYQIALDDFVPQPGYEPLIELADVLKIDFRTTAPAVRKEYAAVYRSRTRRLLAEKVETEEEFETAKNCGYSLFQGYLFSKPSVVSTPAVGGLDANQSRILRVLGRAELDLGEVEQAIKSDPALCYRLLRFLNSSAFYLQTEVRSIIHGLALLGEHETRKWLLLASAVIGLKTKDPHLVSMMLVRARFAELLGPEVRLPSSSLFMLGLLSLMHALLGLSLPLLADRIAMSPEIRDALKGELNPMGRCLQLIVSFETADWETCEKIRKTWPISVDTLTRSYVEAARWAREILAT
jgi:c-di-GMP-related signal transduction protein